jgi:hypothetical protein
LPYASISFQPASKSFQKLQFLSLIRYLSTGYEANRGKNHSGGAADRALAAGGGLLNVLFVFVIGSSSQEASEGLAPF